jgi:regulator of protease activity HflC (stomatin/prohibitin superfamily)
MLPGIIVALVVLFFLVATAVRVIPEYERAVVFRLGRVQHGEKGPGVILLWPIIDKMFRISIRVVTMDIEPQDVISRDNVSLKVNAVLYFRVVAPVKAVVNVENFLYATSQLAQTHLRSILGEHTLDELLTSREKINARIQRILDENTDHWGIKVEAVEVKHIDLPADMQRAMAREAESERERRAKIIAAEGELQAASKLREAADTMSANPATIQLRYLQTLLDMSSDSTSTIVFPLPIDILRTFTQPAGAGQNPPSRGV